MSEPTVLLDRATFTAEEAAVEGDSYRHLFRARRLAVGDRVRAVDGAGRARWGEVASVDRRSGVLRLLDEAPPREPAYRLELAVAAPKRDRASWLVEKATELGVAAVRLLASERSPREPGRGTLERLRRVARAAVEQCGRSRVPEVTGVHAWEEVEGLLGGLPDRWLLHTQSSAEAGAGVWHRSGEAGAVLVGPEGGWTAEEARELGELGCRHVWLGERVLRVETAAVVAAARVLLL